ncbi:MAG: KEOPS complex subunit Cgi121 [Candidatus Caldarchaeum sp.]|nr:KEOPS complex subunit Cgi121 [Candidatus Caldarchaeum sp.]
MRVVEFRNYFFAVGVVELGKLPADEFVKKVFANFRNVQLIDPATVMSWDVIDAAVVDAVLAFGTQMQKAKTLVNEVLLRLAATTQVEEAISKAGLSPGSEKALYVVAGDKRETVVETATKIIEMAGGKETTLNENPDVEEIIKHYGIDRRQIEAVQAKERKEAVKLLVIQRMASAMI